MSDEQLFFLVLVLLYLLECIRWVPAGSTVFKSHFGTSFRWRIASDIIGSVNKGIALSNPFPPFGTYFLISPPPIRFSTLGALSAVSAKIDIFNRQKKKWRAQRFDDISSLETQHNSVFLNGSLFAECDSIITALNLQKTLKELLSLSPPERESYIDDYLGRTFDVGRIRVMYDTFKNETLFLRIICFIQFIYMFGVFPGWVFYFGFRNAIWPLLSSILILSLLLGFVFYITHLTLYKRKEEGTLKHAMMMAVYPMAGLRAIDFLARRYFEEFDIVAVASVLCERSEFLKIAGRTVRESEYPIVHSEPVSGTMGSDIESWWRSRRKKALLRFLEEEQIPIDKLLKPHYAHLGRALSYCPRCLCEFSIIEGNCPDCGDIELMPFIPEKGALE